MFLRYKLIYLRKWALINTNFLAFEVKMYGSAVGNITGDH